METKCLHAFYLAFDGRSYVTEELSLSSSVLIVCSDHLSLPFLFIRPHQVTPNLLIESKATLSRKGLKTQNKHVSITAKIFDDFTSKLTTRNSRS